MPVLESHGVGAAAYMCLAQGILTDRYFEGVREGSRAAGNSVFLNAEQVTDQKVATAKKLNEIAGERGQTLAQMALAWCYRTAPVATLIIGASRLSQIDDNLKAMGNLTFSTEELRKIDELEGGCRIKGHHKFLMRQPQKGRRVWIRIMRKDLRTR